MIISKSAIRNIGVAVLLVVILNMVLYFYTDSRGLGSPSLFLSAALVTVAVITFFGILWNGIGPDGLNETVMRTAITVAVVTVYLVLISIVAFFSLPSSSSEQGSIPSTEQTQATDDELPAITQTMLTSFTTIVGIIVPFYFGTSAYIQAKREELAHKSN
jgi:hypothetical protein